MDKFFWVCQYSLVPDNKPKDGDIENYADIHFDFNPPVRTNTFYHTIGRIATIKISDHPDTNTNVEYHPNPANGFGNFKLNNHSSNTYLYFWFRRKVVKSQMPREARLKLIWRNKQQGFYTFKLESDGGRIDPVIK